MEPICLFGLVGVLGVAAAVGMVCSGLNKNCSKLEKCGCATKGSSTGIGIDDKKEK
ncbi:MAG: hypothetical protein HQL15_01555 [Candidatus Omnitrophica bacterium]|nr:hypothetical protein [Candidatus Omnitrophota bacterium]